MKRTAILVMVLIAAAVLGVGGYLVIDSQSNFTGSRVKNPDCYTLQFTEMNQKDSHTLSLHQGDVLSVDFSIEHGRMDLAIGIPTEKSIYKGDNIESGTFEVTVPKDGEYRIDVSAKHAAGSLRIFAHTEEK